MLLHALLKLLLGPVQLSPPQGNSALRVASTGTKAAAGTLYNHLHGVWGEGTFPKPATDIPSTSKHVTVQEMPWMQSRDAGEATGD